MYRSSAEMVMLHGAVMPGRGSEATSSIVMGRRSSHGRLVADAADRWPKPSPPNIAASAGSALIALMIAWPDDRLARRSHSTKVDSAPSRRRLIGQ
jgi:hypothetical protein